MELIKAKIEVSSNTLQAPTQAELKAEETVSKPAAAQELQIEIWSEGR